MVLLRTELGATEVLFTFQIVWRPRCNMEVFNASCAGASCPRLLQERAWTCIYSDHTMTNFRGCMEEMTVSEQRKTHEQTELVQLIKSTLFYLWFLS